MDSVIFIDGPAVWVVLVLLLFMFIIYCMLGCGYLRGKKEIYKKDRTIKRLRADNNRLVGMYIKDCGSEGQVKRDG